MLVRHPMERLVSCYFDKMVNGTHKSLRGFRKFVKNKAQSIRRNRREQVNKKKGVYAPLPEDKIGKHKTCFVHPIFHFWFFVTFGEEVMKIRKNYMARWASRNG